MSLKKKLSTILSVLGVLNMTSINNATAKTFDYYENFDDFEDDDDPDDDISEEKSDTANSTDLAADNQNSENTSQDENQKNIIEKLSNHTNELMTLLFLTSFCTKVYNNSITVPKSRNPAIPKLGKKLTNALPVGNRKTDWPKTITMKDLKAKAENFWTEQGYTKINEAKSNSVIVKAYNKSEETKSGEAKSGETKPVETVDLCYYKPDGFFGPTYAINGNKHAGLEPSTELVADNTELVDISEDCDTILVQLIDQIQQVWNKENKVDGEEKNLSLGDIVYIYTNLVSKLKEKNVNEPGLTATWLLLGNNKANTGAMGNIACLPFIEIMINNLPIISLLFPFNIELQPSKDSWIKSIANFFTREFTARLPVLNVKNSKKELTLANEALGHDKTYKLEENNDWKLPKLDRGLKIYGEQLGKYNLEQSMINTFIDVRNIGGYSDVYGILKYLLDSFSTFYRLVSPLLDIGISLDNNFDEYIKNIEVLTSNKLFEKQRWPKDISGYLHTLKSHRKLVKSLCNLLKKTKTNNELDKMLDKYVEMAPASFQNTKPQEANIKKAKEKYEKMEEEFSTMSDDLKLAKYLQTRIPSEDGTDRAKECRRKVEILIKYLENISKIDVKTLKQGEESKAKEYCWLLAHVPSPSLLSFFGGLFGGVPWYVELHNNLGKMKESSYDDKINKIKEALHDNRQETLTDTSIVISEVKKFLNETTPGWTQKKAKDIKLKDIF